MPTSEATTSVTPECSPPGALTDGVRSFASAGATREYFAAVPSDFDPTRPTPVILNFHGSGSDMRQQIAYSRLPVEGTARGYVVVTPEGSGSPKGWPLAGSASFDLVTDLIADLEEGMCPDPARIYATGISNGSAISGLLVCRAPFRIAAAAMVAATVGPPCPDDVRRPVLAFHGTDDPVVPYSGGDIANSGNGASGAVGVGGAEVAVGKWAQHNGCGLTPTVEKIGDDVEHWTFSGCVDGNDVVFYKIIGGGHTWPGPIDVAKLGLARLGATSATVDATALILDFFDTHRLVS